MRALILSYAIGAFVLWIIIRHVAPPHHQSSDEMTHDLSDVFVPRGFHDGADR